MTVDLSTFFSSAQAVFSTDTVVQSTDWIDMKVAQNLGDGHGPVVAINVSTSFAGGTSAAFELTACDVNGANAVVIDTTPPIAVAALVAASGTPPMGGYTYHLRMSPKATIPSSTLTHLRMQVRCVGAVSAGAVTMCLVPEAGSASPRKAYASGY